MSPPPSHLGMPVAPTHFNFDFENLPTFIDINAHPDSFASLPPSNAMPMYQSKMMNTNEQAQHTPAIRGPSIDELFNGCSTSPVETGVAVFSSQEGALVVGNKKFFEVRVI